MKILDIFPVTYRLKIVFKHSLVSLICALTDFFLFYAFFYYLDLSLEVAFVIAVFFSALIALYGHTYFTFQVNKIAFRNIIYFIVQLAISMTIGFLVFDMFLYFKLSPEMSKICQIFCTFWFNILFGKFITFK